VEQGRTCSRTRVLLETRCSCISNLVDVCFHDTIRRESDIPIGGDGTLAGRSIHSH